MPYEFVFGVGAVPWDVIKARHRAAVNRGRCVCGSKREPGPKTGPVFLINGRDIGRKFIPCRRCLGTIKEVS